MTDIDRTAPVLVRHEVLIAADPATVWRLHTDIAAWPTWNADITTAELVGALAEGATFHWHTHGLDIASTVLELVPGRRIVWGGPAHGIDGVHVWTFAPADGGTLVTTEESWAGPPVDADPEGLRAALDASLTAWLGNLRAAAEH